MKFKHGLVTAGCLAAMGLAGSAQAVQIAGELLEVYGNFYPQYQISNFSDGSGVASSNLTAGAAALPGTPAPAVAASPSKTQLNWVNSYLGFKGQKAFGDIKVGYDLQAVVMKTATNTTDTLLTDARDAYLFIGHEKLGTLQLGQMDTIYKEWTDRVRLLGISSSNITSSSGIMSGVTFAGRGVTTFNTRINGQLRWTSPNWSGVEVGVSLRPDPGKTATQDQSLNSLGVRWSNPTYYVALVQESHNDYKAISGSLGATAGTIYNAATVRSKDTVNRLTLGYTAEKYRLGADFSSMKYTEDGAVGKFADYQTTAWLVSGEYKLTPQVTLGANYVSGAAGSCSIVGGAACSTDGLGGRLMSMGVRYDLDKNVGVYAIYAKNMVGSSAVLANGAVGGDVTNAAVGLHVKF